MYVIVVYDVGEKRVGKMLKLCRQYLCWIRKRIRDAALYTFVYHYTFAAKSKSLII